MYQPVGIGHNISERNRTVQEPGCMNLLPNAFSAGSENEKALHTIKVRRKDNRAGRAEGPDYRRNPENLFPAAKGGREKVRKEVRTDRGGVTATSPRP